MTGPLKFWSSFAVIMAAFALLLYRFGPLSSPDDPRDEAPFRSEVVGIEVTKPHGWHLQSLEELARLGSVPGLDDATLQKLRKQLPIAPLVATRYPEPYDSLNPTFEFWAWPLDPIQGSKAPELLHLLLKSLASMVEEFRLIQDISELRVDGVRGAKATAEYIFEAEDGSVYPTRSTIVVVPKGRFLYQFSFSGVPSGPDALSGEVESVLSSVKFL